MPAAATRPRSIVQWDTTLKTNTRRVYGFQPYCACGWEGKVWRTHHESQLERSFHVCEKAAPTAEPQQCGAEYRSLGLRCVLPAGHKGPHTDTPSATVRAEAS